MKKYHDKNLVLAHRQAKSNETLRMKLSTSCGKGFWHFLASSRAEQSIETNISRAWTRKTCKYKKLNLFQLSVLDYPQTHFNESMNAKQTILEQRPREEMAYLIEKQARLYEALNRKQKAAMEKTKDHAAAIQALEAASTNLETTNTDDSTDRADSHEALKEIVMRLESLASRMKILESSIKDLKGCWWS